VIGALGVLWVQLGDGGGIHAILQEVASASVRPDLGLDVAVETSQHPQPPYGQYVSQITVTNLKSQPTRLEYVIINGSTDDACIKRPNQTLKEGEAYRVRSGGLFGMCGSIVRVSIRSDRGEQDYQFRP
jgi:hypothetical protein